MRGLRLPTGDGSFFDWAPSREPLAPPERPGFTSRKAYAATHVVADADAPPGSSAVDWEATLAFRHRIWSLGLGVAEAMDTAQRGAGLDWEMARELITRTQTEAEAVGGRAVHGVGTDQLAPVAQHDIARIAEAYREQVSLVEDLGGTAVLLASRHLVVAARSPDDYMEVYGSVISEVRRPVLIHWLGEIFDPMLHGYWGSAEPWIAVETLLGLAKEHSDRIEGIKVSLLDAELERSLRSRLPESVSVYTGDDFNFVDLILGDDSGHSEALLGVLDPIATAAAVALQALDRGDVSRYREVLEPTVALSRHLFGDPTAHYKTGIVFLAYLNGYQDHRRMLDEAQTDRSLGHLARLLVLADDAGVLADPELAVKRMRAILDR